MSISICIATSNDYYAVNSLVGEGHEEHVMEEPAIFKSVESVMPESYFKDLLEDQNSHIFIAKNDELVVGFAIISIEHSPSFQSLVRRKYGYIHDFGVRKALQKQGVGGLLFTGCKEWAKARGATSIELNVWEFNANAIAFYEHLGMKGISRKMSMNI
ncbi:MULTISPECIES: GNAT family N-acetyltransferase [Lysinibacillus]|uniref:GNAT family N-acetyltransferase n=1 Tax=Lysinibacillus TaxID=400634 RepID=UPI001C305D03|nr:MULTISPECIES: GNAT family N-acetyltransferase [Lysinibacillus]MCE4044037.1 GNAT family N-acetyltransferase [Lysinibacillus fusiformis]